MLLMKEKACTHPSKLVPAAIFYFFYYIFISLPLFHYFYWLLDPCSTYYTNSDPTNFPTSGRISGRVSIVRPYLTCRCQPLLPNNRVDRFLLIWTNQISFSTYSLSCLNEILQYIKKVAHLFSIKGL